MNQPYVQDHLQQPLRSKWRHFLDIVKWMVVTTVYAAFAPWAIVASIGMVIWLLGLADIEDIRSMVVGAATSTQSGWHQAVEVWDWYMSLVVGIVVFWRIVFSPAATLAEKRVVTAWNDWFKRTFPNTKIRGEDALMVATALCFGVLILLLETFTSPTTSIGKLSPEEVHEKYPPRDGIALQMKDGRIVSGAGEIARIDDNAYLVKLNDGGAR